ncbi:exodeoxyribonuclease V subunit gamma [Halorhodospira neutriphila]|uniref:RecBCD enzyme subunit RecC n=1 Tax=Halorhodospira neutriphila TaxID=168379 RepID=A0ABS1E3E4_9GAMM|nr:exodeoxyribonuclease V subunit gamma [Halorhodospira neutriphila]MBK1725488.1 exodeoxyribonuclease V subunit gamma [Halorhodospira neutriphila]
MFYLYHHHDPTRLAELLAALRERRAGDPLRPDTVLVPNRSVGRWLQMQLAEAEGVAANLALPLPAKFIWWLLSTSLAVDRGEGEGGTPDSSAFERENLRWHLYALLPRLGAEQPRVAQYLSERPRELRRLQLAEQLADVFDQYLIYRRDMLFAWEAGEERAASPDEWQAPVWRALVARLGRRHRARLLTELLEAVEAGGPLERSHWPSAVYCFGLVNLPPDYLRLLYGIGRDVDVHYLVTNPSDVYWGDIERRPVRLYDAEAAGAPPGEAGVAEGHPLLASLGHSARDFLRVLYADELSAIQEPELGEALAYEPPGDGSLLHRVQSGIIRMDARPAATGVAAGDTSLEIHACHGPLREVQVLREQILDRMSRDETLQPREIVVMLPDVARYAPAIHSVFGDRGAAQRLPYTVSDQPRRSVHPLAMTFAQLLDLPLSRWSASEVLALAGVPAVMRRYGLDEAALAELRAWTQAAGVRWGLDAETRRRLGAGDWSQHTWAFGLDRLLAGIAQADEQALVDGVAPWSDLEGGATEHLGRLYVLVERLREMRDAMERPVPAAQWQERLNGWLEALFELDPEDGDEQAALAAVREAVGVLGGAAQSLGDEPLGWEAVREIVRAELDDGGERQPFLGGGITFCGLMPLRALPFRMVALLGLDDGAFPRQDRNRAFNILRRSPRLGDRSARDDDRLLFLQSLMAARDWLYLSYTGQDVRSGEALEPSPVVGELLDFLHRFHFPEVSRAEAAARVVVRQPMQPFSERHFRSDAPRVLTFDAQWHAGTQALRGERAAAPAFLDGSALGEPEAEPAVELAALQRVLEAPARWFFRERLGLELEGAADAPADEEPLSLDGLAGYGLRAELLEALREPQAEPPAQPDPLLQARGVLPPPPLDQGAYQGLLEQLRPLLPLWQAWQPEIAAAGPLAIDCRLPSGARLIGRLGDVGEPGLCRVHPGRLHGRRLLRDWVDYLAVVAARGGGRLRCAGVDREGALEQRRAEVPAADAAAWLDALVGVYREAQRRPLPFLPSLGVDYQVDQDPAASRRPKDAAAALRSRNGYLSNTWRPAWEWRADPYFRLAAPPPAYLGEDPATSDFCRIAEAVCGPLVAHLRAEEAA